VWFEPLTFVQTTVVDHKCAFDPYHVASLQSATERSLIVYAWVDHQNLSATAGRRSSPELNAIPLDRKRADSANMPPIK